MLLPTDFIIPIPVLQAIMCAHHTPVEAFTNEAHIAFHEFLHEEDPHRFRFDDTKYDKYKAWILEHQSGVQPRRLNRKTQKVRQRVIKKFYLNEDQRLCCLDSNGRELKVLRDWQLFGVITNTHSSVHHAGQEKTYTTLMDQYYGIVRTEVRWLLKHCKVCFFFL